VDWFVLNEDEHKRTFATRVFLVVLDQNESSSKSVFKQGFADVFVLRFSPGVPAPDDRFQRCFYPLGDTQISR